MLCNNYVIIMRTCKVLSEQKRACVEKMESSDSESESDRAVSTMTSGLETGSGQASNAESTIPESSSDASTSTASSLLARLRSPRPSDLARKRQVKSNPPRGARKGKGTVTADPKTVSPSDRVKAYHGENFTISNKKLFCCTCREELAVKKSVIECHIASQKHKRGRKE